jgi:hypothetical protein
MNGFALLDAIATLRLYCAAAARDGTYKQLPLDRPTQVSPRQDILVYVPPRDIYTQPSKHSKTVQPRYIRTVPGHWIRTGVLDYRWALS